MTIKSYRVGPGTLTLGSGPLAVAAQMTKCQVDAAENVTTTEDITVLSGEVLSGDEDATYKFTLAASILQDISSGGIVDYSWIHKGEEVAFSYVPNTVEDREVSGTVVPIPITIGGEVKARAVSDFTWRIIGDPTFGDA
jgi:hypothetical protein